jgi:hypothetical protein
MVPLVEIPEFHTEKPSESQLAEWEAQLWDKGYLIIPNALPPAAVKHFETRMRELPDCTGYGNQSSSLVRLFEQGMDFVHLLENEPVFSLMERILGQQMHIIALQGHRMRAGTEVIGWHPDELYVTRPEGVSDDVEFPPIINVINCHYYVVDVPLELGPTMIVPGSHRACRRPRPEDGNPPSWRGQQAIAATVKAGDCVMYSNQVWHTGSPNQTDQLRLAVVPAYSRRWVAQRFWPFLNYNLSRDILDQCTQRQRELLGEHPRGAYG